MEEQQHETSAKAVCAEPKHTHTSLNNTDFKSKIKNGSFCQTNEEEKLSWQHVFFFTVTGNISQDCQKPSKTQLSAVQLLIINFNS